MDNLKDSLINLLKRIKKHLKKGTLVIDVCSVKELPAKWMKEILPKHVQILATHPLFGPDSVSSSLRGKKIVLCKIRMPNLKYNLFKSYLKKKGLEIIETTPQKHDQDIANSLALTHFIGRSLIELNVKELQIDTKGYNRLLRILDTVKNDTWELFKDMNNYNPYATKTRKGFIKAVNKINQRLKK